MRIAFFLLFALLINPVGHARALSHTQEARAIARQHPVAWLGADRDWAPMDFVNEQGIADGFDADLVALLNREPLKNQIRGFLEVPHTNPRK